MPDSAATEMKARLRADLRTAMTSRNSAEVKVIRSLVAALDNAEAPEIAQHAAAARHQFASRSAEVDRLHLSWPQVHDILRAEHQERERAATGLERLGRPDHAANLRQEAAVIRRYMD